MQTELQKLLLLDKPGLLAAVGKNHLCRYCNGQLDPTQKTDQRTGRVWWIWPDRHGCLAEKAALEREVRERVEAAKREKEAEFARAMQSAGLTGQLARYRFETFGPRADWPAALDVCQRVQRYASYVVEGGRDKPWLVLHGNFGAGKSHLAASVIRYALEAGMRQCYFRAWTQYLTRLQKSWSRKGDLDDEFGAESEADIIEELTNGRLVVLDDIDKREPSPWAKRVLFDVMNTRYNQLGPTVVTFNYGLGDRDPAAGGVLALVPFLGQAVLERIVEHAFDVIAFDCESYRLA